MTEITFTIIENKNGKKRSKSFCVGEKRDEAEAKRLAMTFNNSNI
jgi:hypothetical protein